MEEQRFRGIGVSPGITLGHVYLLQKIQPRIIYQFLIDRGEVKKEISRFKKAVNMAKAEFLKIRKGLPIKEIIHILDAYTVILKDPFLYKATLKRIKDEKINAEWALLKSMEEIEKIFLKIDDDYLRQRFQDIKYVANRVLRYLTGESSDFRGIQDAIIVAHGLSPAETTHFQTNNVAGFVTEIGGRTSHTAIVAQALKIPAVVGVKEITYRVRDGDFIIIDGLHGEVIVNPASATIEEYYKKEKEYKLYQREIEKYTHLPAQTPDGFQLKVMANVELFEEVHSVLSAGAEGIGLFRTEFFYLEQMDFPDEESLFAHFRKTVELVSPYSVTFRTLDIGGDKFVSRPDFGEAINPALGLRAIRLCLNQRTLFRTQLRAILKASIYGKARILIPFISSLEEVHQVKAILKDIKSELKKQGYPFDEHIPLGIMIEVPSAVAISEFLAKEVDFFSIGTNDLIQYALAIDRANEQVAYLYEPLHPAVLQMIKVSVEAAKKAGIKVGICGEMAAEPAYIPLILGFGLDEISVNMQAIPLIKRLIRETNFRDVHCMVNEILKLPTAIEIKNYVKQALQNFPQTLNNIG